MRIELHRSEEPYHLEAVNEDGAVLHLDASPEIGGCNKGFRPMQAVLAALGGCSSIDVLEIFRKQRAQVDDLHVSIEAEREEGKTPALFRTIHVRFRLTGHLDPTRVKRAVDLSMDKYCSVARLLEPTASITSSFEIVTPPENSPAA